MGLIDFRRVWHRGLELKNFAMHTLQMRKGYTGSPKVDHSMILFPVLNTGTLFKNRHQQADYNVNVGD